MLSISWILKSSVSSLIGVGNIRKFIRHFSFSWNCSSCFVPSHTSTKWSVECKHCHIVETGVALLAHADVPIKFWDDAFLTATYLINRLPTTYLINRLPTLVIDKKFLLERLFHTSPNYSSLKNIWACLLASSSPL